MKGLLERQNMSIEEFKMNMLVKKIETDELDRILEEIQQKAFMEGYAYAIQVLTEGIPEKEKQPDDND